jgi:hypothetical protein
MNLTDQFIPLAQQREQKINIKDNRVEADFPLSFLFMLFSAAARAK